MSFNQLHRLPVSYIASPLSSVIDVMLESELSISLYTAASVTQALTSSYRESEHYSVNVDFITRIHVSGFSPLFFYNKKSSVRSIVERLLKTFLSTFAFHDTAVPLLD